VKFTGVLHSLDGSVELRVEKTDQNARVELGSEWAEELLANGGKELMAEIKKHFDGK
jgi:porphobilinogen deaminase